MHAYISNSVDNTSTPLITYSREKLFRLCSFQYSTPQLSGYFSYNKTKTNYHGCRAGKKVKEKRSKIFMNIPVVNIHQSRKTAKRHTAEQNRTRNLVKIKTRKIPTISKLVPKCVVMNARSLAKPDAAPALYAELKSNIDVCFVSESWLNKRIPSHLICPDGYTIIRKDRVGARTGGGVAIICRNDWKIRVLNFKANFEFETVWCKIQTTNSKYYMASIYHPLKSN